MSASKEDKLRDMNITKDEVDRIGKALKDESFRKLFVEYAEEIADPKNRELYEKEIAMMEAERGMDVQFIHPVPGHVLKFFGKQSDDESIPAKIFVNICHNEHIGKPTNEKRKQPNGKLGIQWSIPHSFSPVRDDVDKKGDKCAVYDVVFHSDTYKMSSNPAFLKMIHDTALDGLEKHFGIEFDRESMVRMKQMKFKGVAQPTIMRKKNTSQQESNGTDNAGADGAGADGAGADGESPLQFPYPYESGLTSEELAERKAKEDTVHPEFYTLASVTITQVDEQRRLNAGSSQDSSQSLDGSATRPKTPRHSLVSQFGVDLSDFTESSSSKSYANIPAAFELTVQLPELKSASSCDLDVTERHVRLTTQKPVSYLLELDLPYPVDEDSGSARFDKTKHQLIVKLVVNRRKADRFAQYTDSPLISEHDPATGSTDTSHTDITPAVELGGQERREDLSYGDLNNTEEAKINPHSTEEEAEVANERALLDPNTMYKLPVFSYENDDECVTLVLEVQHVDTDSLRLFISGREVETTFHTVSSTGFKTHYYLCTIFPGSVDQVQKNIGDRNVVLNVYREQCDTNIWTKFFSRGANSQDTETHEFLSKSQILSELESLEILAKEGTKIVDQHSKHEPESMVVTEMNSSHLCIDIKGIKGKPWKPKTPEVVHMQATPDAIHGILKHANSDTEIADATSSHVNGGSDVQESQIEQTPVQEQPPVFRERKKSVSFSEKIEETKFKSKETVSHMHKTLSNRRKKRRQRENNYQRRHSSNSECSSGDETGKHHRSRHSSSASEDGSSIMTTESPRSECSDVASTTDDDVYEMAAGDFSPSDRKSNDVDITDSSDMATTNDVDNDTGSRKNHDNDNDGDDDDDDDDNMADSANSDISAVKSEGKRLFEFDNAVIFDLDD